MANEQNSGVYVVFVWEDGVTLRLSNLPSVLRILTYISKKGLQADFYNFLKKKKVNFNPLNQISSCLCGSVYI